MSNAKRRLWCYECLLGKENMTNSVCKHQMKTNHKSFKTGVCTEQKGALLNCWPFSKT